MEKKRIRNLLLGGALAAGLGVAVERGFGEDTDKEKDMSPAKPVAEHINKPQITIPDSHEIISVDTAKPPEEYGEEYQESLNEDEDMYDPRIIGAIEKIFSGIQTSSNDGSLFERIRAGDLFLSRDIINGEELYSLKKWTGDNLEYDKDHWKFHTTNYMVDITSQPDGSFLLRTSDGDLYSSCDEATLPEAILEYVRFAQDYTDWQNDLFYKKDKNYVELIKLNDYYEARLRRLEELKKQKWRFIPTGQEYQDVINKAIRDASYFLGRIKDEIAQTQP